MPSVAGGRACVAWLIVAVACGATALAQPAPRRAEANRGTVSGRVVDARSGAPLADVLVQVVGGDVSASSDGSGRFVIADVPSGPVELYVAAVGFALLRRTIDVPRGAALDVEFRLAEGSGYAERVDVIGHSAAPAEGRCPHCRR